MSSELLGTVNSEIVIKPRRILESGVRRSIVPLLRSFYHVFRLLLDLVSSATNKVGDFSVTVGAGQDFFQLAGIGFNFASAFLMIGDRLPNI